MRIPSIPFAIQIEIERKEKSLRLDMFKKTNNVNNNNNKERKKIINDKKQTLSKIK